MDALRHVYYLTRPDFLKHHHIHKRKVQALREAGLSATLIAFVPEEMYRSRQAEYERVAREGSRRMVRVPQPYAVNGQVTRFFARRLLVQRRVLVHVLLCDATPLLELKRRSILGRRLRLVIEHEGDVASESLYRWAYGKFEPPPDEPPTEFRPEYDRIVAHHKAELMQADGAILVTQEHLALWERRLGRPLSALLLPSTVEAAQFRFDARQRQRIRAELGISDKWVLVYSGSVSLSWQRFECVCQLVQRLVDAGHPAFLLALVHPDGHATAQKMIVQHGLESCSSLRAVAPQDMGAWLSAADVALFLRHNHVMNRVVTSAKLGEYLAAGLPLITTWGSPYFRAFAETQSAAVVLPDSLEWPKDFQAQLELLVARGKDYTWRAQFSEAFERTFAGKSNPLSDYVQFIADLLR